MYKTLLSNGMEKQGETYRITPCNITPCNTVIQVIKIKKIHPLVYP